MDKRYQSGNLSSAILLIGAGLMVAAQIGRLIRVRNPYKTWLNFEPKRVRLTDLAVRFLAERFR